MPFSIRRVATLIVVFAVVAAACGGDDEPTAAPTTAAPPTTDAPAAATTVAPDTTEPGGGEVSADPGRTAQAGDAVSVHYVGTLDSGEQFDSSRDRGQTLAVVLGSGGVIAGFDAALMGMKVGDIKTVRIEAADAYGEWTEERVVRAPIDQVPEGTVVGDELFSGAQRFIVIEITDTEVVLDGNHRLAGEALTFEIELVSFDN